ncbi:hypothetical protein ABEB36_012396 [Hypothenemus hampei]|uniref:WH2 domain-containing protein n=2 Tax=Hypothenemus hampei TaxID=57062 RepID=A0ABD1EB82_HYPHA
MIKNTRRVPKRMSGPPPPPPPGPPPAPTFSVSKAALPDDRGALLKSIRQGTKLKKTVTVDKSGPMLPGKANNIGSNNNNNNTNHSGANGTSNNSTPQMALGGLFAGGMPKLRPTGRRPSNNSVESDKSPSPSATPSSKNFGSVQDQLKKQLHNPSDTRIRGPPPPAPTRHISIDDTAKGLNGMHQNQSSLHANKSSLHNNSTLHRKAKSNANLSSLDCTDNVNNGICLPNKPVINHGKPNLAPKPPILNGKPTPPTKLSLKPNKTISRAQSMRTPRSPSPQSPTPNDASIKFGTVRNMSSLLGQSLNNLNSQNSGYTKTRPALLGRPTVPPPSVPAPAAPSPNHATPVAKLVRPPNHAPPPPPGLPQPPNHAPPPPPHKTQVMPQPSRPPPAVPNSANPPPPPPRHSSMRDATSQPTRRIIDLEEKFRSSFNTPDKFPRPPPYRNVLKLYSNRQESSC